MVVINGIRYEGRSISVSGNKVVIDGKDVTPDSKKINILVEGNLEKINVDYCEKIVVGGNVKEITTGSGDVECGDVTGNVHASSGDIECGNVGGNVETMSGDVKCENVSGNVKTVSGDIKHRK